MVRWLLWQTKVTYFSFLPTSIPPFIQAHEPEGQEDVPLHVINSFFSVGCDAQVALEFQLDRGTTTTVQTLNITRIKYEVDVMCVFREKCSIIILIEWKIQYSRRKSIFVNPIMWKVAGLIIK